MENYVISDDTEYHDPDPPFPTEALDGEPSTSIVFKARCEDVERCISLVEVLKRRLKKKVYQWNEVAYAHRVDYWNPMIEGMDRMQCDGSSAEFEEVGSTPRSGEGKMSDPSEARPLRRGKNRNPWQREKKSKPVVT